MGPSSHTPDSDTHVLGPHVVGQRVVVRRLVPGETGPSGGPAMTDLLGVCLSWSATSCVVQPESGPAVEIPLALIVSGKPVPPRPSVRHRVPVREAESHVVSLWDLEVVPLGDWTLRFSPDVPRRRANSCLAMGEPGLPFPEAEIRSFYASRGREPLVQVELGSPVEQEFRDAGWAPLDDGDAHFQLASLARVRRLLGVRPEVPVTVTGTTATAALPQATGQAALDGDWLGLHGLYVDPSARRRGLARDVLASLLEWGAEQGATTAWLHVETDNKPALGLYESLGFATHHTCRYLRMQ